LHESYAIVII